MIGSEELSPTPDIVLSGAGVLPLHCRVVLREGVATLLPAPAAQCWLNTVLLDGPAKLSQGNSNRNIIKRKRNRMFPLSIRSALSKPLSRQKSPASVL